VNLVPFIVLDFANVRDALLSRKASNTSAMESIYRSV